VVTGDSAKPVKWPWEFAGLDDAKAEIRAAVGYLLRGATDGARGGESGFCGLSCAGQSAPAQGRLAQPVFETISRPGNACCPPKGAFAF
jgi:hypothetical protein